MVLVLVILVIVAILIFSGASNKTRRENELLTSYYRMAHALDITKYEAQTFMSDLAKKQGLQQNAELYRTAIHELRARVSVPRGLSGDHRSLISIEPAKSANG
jgi:predicted RecB family endonuclease